MNPSRRFVRFLVLALGLATLVAPHAPAEHMSPERRRETLTQGLEALEQAAARATRPDQAAPLYREAIAAFESLSESGVRNADLSYNLGIAYFRIGDIGKAVLHFQRAAKLEPRDARIAANLKYVRDRVEPFVASSGQRRMLDSLLIWNELLSIRARLWLAGFCGALGWLCLAFWLRRRRSGLGVVASVFIFVGLVTSLGAAWQIRQDTREPAAVVVRGTPTLRLGRGEGADPALSQPLGPGVEVHILQERGGWSEVRLADDKLGWLPSDALERV